MTVRGKDRRRQQRIREHVLRILDERRNIPDRDLRLLTDQEIDSLGMPGSLSWKVQMNDRRTYVMREIRRIKADLRYDFDRQLEELRNTKLTMPTGVVTEDRSHEVNGKFGSW